MKMKIVTTVALMLATSMVNAKVHAVVNGENLTDADMKPMLQMFGAKSIAELDENKKKMLLDQSVEKKLIAQKALKDKIDQDPEFQKVINDFKNRLLVDFWMKKKYDSIKVSDEEVTKYIKETEKSLPKGIKVQENQKDIRDKAKMQKFQVLVDEKLSNMKKEAIIEYK